MAELIPYADEPFVDPAQPDSLSATWLAERIDMLGLNVARMTASLGSIDLSATATASALGNLPPPPITARWPGRQPGRT